MVGRLKRIAIFVFYDPCGIVDSYVEVLLEKMLECVQKLVIVVNGFIDVPSYEILKKYTEYVYIRGNLGYDGGAYKDAILYYLKDEPWEQWDELVLFNDTFYGPFENWKKVFDLMEKEEVDFWGLSKHLGSNGQKIWHGKALEAHIQGYFVVCRRQLVLSEIFFRFWNQLEYPISYEEAVEKFEISFSSVLHRDGFVSKAYTDVSNPDFKIEYCENVYTNKPYELICKADFPIIKRRVLDIEFFSRGIEAIEYVKKNTNYDSGLITKHMERLSKVQSKKSFSPVLLQEFYDGHEKIYIYGHGEYAKSVTLYFDYKGWKFEKYIVTRKKENEPDIISFHELNLKGNEGIILALGKKALEEVYPMLKNEVNKANLFVPQY